MPFLDLLHAIPTGGHTGLHNKHKTLRVLRAFLLLGVLVAALLLSGCLGDKDEKDKKEGAGQESTEQTQVAEPEIEPEPHIMVGNAKITMPEPPGFVRVDIAAPLAHEARVSMDNEEVLLGLFARNAQADTPAIAEPAAGEVDDSGLLMITTLKKWVNSNFSPASFEELKTAWQKESLLCNQEVLENFIEAANTRLADRPEYSYNLGMTGFSSQQISFAKIEKSAAADGGAVFNCSLNTLLFRNGKILRVYYLQRIDNFAEIMPTIDAYMRYLQELQAGDGPVSEDLGRQTLRVRPQAGAEVSVAPSGRQISAQ